MSLLNRLSLRMRLVVLFLIFGILPAGLIAATVWYTITEAQLEKTERNLLLLRENKAAQIEWLFETLGEELETLAYSRTTVEALGEFSSGYASYARELKNRPGMESLRATLKEFYRGPFQAEYAKRNGGAEFNGINSVLDKLDFTDLALQAAYIANNPSPLGQKDRFTMADDGSAWTQVHKKHHGFFNFARERYKIYDLFLVDAAGTVVYSAAKEADFATSLKSGPYADSPLADVYKKAMKLEAGETAYSELAPYLPSYMDLALFMAAPVFTEAGERIGVLIFQVPTQKIDEVLTGDGKWLESGYGRTGEALLLSSDRRVMSFLRAFVEDPDWVAKHADRYGVSPEQIQFMKVKSTAAATIQLNSEPAKAVARGETGYAEATDYRGEEAFISYRPLKIKGLPWGIQVKIDRSEALDLGKTGVAVTTVFLVSLALMGVLSWLFSTTLARRIVHVASRLQSSARATRENGEKLKAASQHVSSAATEQASAIQETVATLDEITAMVNRSVESAQSSAEKAASSSQISAEGQKAVSEMIHAMNEISSGNEEVMRAIRQSNERISGIVKVIEQIAEKTNVINEIVFQTKLLSFNASVEAARAGEHGKGFAVVAEEVGNLARMSGVAAQEIGQMLGDSIGKVDAVVKESNSSIDTLMSQVRHRVESGVKVANRCGTILQEVVANVQSVTRMMDAITQASKEQAEGVSNISSAMNQLDESTHMNSTSAQETASAAEALAREAMNLNEAVRDLEREVHGSRLARPAVVEVPTPRTAAKGPAPVVPLRRSESVPEKPAPEKTSKAPMAAAAGAEFNVPSGDDPRFEEF